MSATADCFSTGNCLSDLLPGVLILDARVPTNAMGSVRPAACSLTQVYAMIAIATVLDKSPIGFPGGDG